MASNVTSETRFLTLPIICNELAVVQHKLHDICVQMNMPQYKATEFMNSKGNGLTEAIDYWLNGNVKDVSISWETIVNALESKHVDEYGLAQRIRKKYCQQTTECLGQEAATIDSQSSSDNTSDLSSVDLASLDEYFPYLSKDGMSETELSHYRLKLEKDTNKIKKSFAALVSNLQYHIRETCKVEDIINHMKFSDRKFDEVLCSCKNVTDVFSDLYKFFSFFDFDIIKMLTSKFGSESCKKKLKKYQKKFREFTKRRVCECPSDTFGNAKRPVDASTQYVLKIEDNIKEYTLKDLEKLQFEMNRILKQKFLRVLHVDKGCIELTFRAVGDVCLKLSEEEKQEMRNLGWLSICCGEKEYQDLRNIERISMAKPGKISGDSGFGSAATESTQHTETTQNDGKWDDPTEELLKSAKRTSIGSTADLHDIIVSGDVERLKLAIQDKVYNPLSKDVFNFNALHTAAKYGKVDMLKFLVGQGGLNPSLSGSHGVTPLHIAAEAGHLHIVEYLVNDLNIDPYVKDEEGYLPLHRACSANHLAIVRCLIKKFREYMSLDTQLTDFTKDGFTPLHVAINSGHLEMVQYLTVECKSNSNFRTKAGKFPIFIACQLGYLEIVKHLVEVCECDPSFLDHRNNAPLHISAKYGHLHITSYLIKEKGCDVKAVNTIHNTPLLEAAFAGQVDMVQYLIGNIHCDPKIRGNKDYNCLHAACHNDHDAVLNYLIDEQHMDPCETAGKSESNCLHIAASNGKLAIVRSLFQRMPTNYKCHGENARGRTPLHLAAHNNHLNIVKYLIEEKDWVPDIQSAKCGTPLMLALKRKTCCDTIDYLKTRKRGTNPAKLTILHHIAKYGTLKEMKYEACKFADADHLSEHDQTPVHIAAERGSLEIIRYLVEQKGCDPRRRDTSGATPLHLAAGAGQLHIVKYLITKQKCEPTCETSLNYDDDAFSKAFEKTTPLHTAALYGQLKVIEYLLESDFGLDADIQSKHGHTPLQCAAMYGHLSVIKYLVKKHSCNPVHQDKKLNTALHYAAMSCHSNVLGYLVHNLKCDPDLENIDTMKPLLLAASEYCIDTVKYCISVLKLNPNTCNRYKITSLHIAADKGHLDLVKYLTGLSKCDIFCKDSMGETPLHKAAQGGHLNVVKYLTSQNSMHLSVDNSGNIPLHLAVKDSHFEVTKFLIETLHTPLASKNNDLKTPLDYAREHSMIYYYLIVTLFSECDSDQLFF